MTNLPPLTMNVFYHSGAVEVRGRRTNGLIAECERYGIAPPLFEERQGFIVVTFKAPVAEGAGAEKTKEKSTEKILRLIASSPKITTLEIAEAIGLSRAGVEKAIKKLKQEGRLSRIGPDKGGEWEVIR